MGLDASIELDPPARAPLRGPYPRILSPPRVSIPGRARRRGTSASGRAVLWKYCADRLVPRRGGAQGGRAQGEPPRASHLTCLDSDICTAQSSRIARSLKDRRIEPPRLPAQVDALLTLESGGEAPRAFMRLVVSARPPQLSAVGRIAVGSPEWRELVRVASFSRPASFLQLESVFCTVGALLDLRRGRSRWTACAQGYLRLSRATCPLACCCA